ncbi:MAG: glycoside hydrolase [Gammaproteobacteria bacterium]|nr:glycoside hydrolase [Gammaproteobacteria bacterium]
MSDKNRLKVVLCWHMHQPDYRGPEQGDFQLPWVYLHAIKDYIDMACHLEQIPNARAVVNFAPVLLEQLDDYSSQIKNWLERGVLIRDPLLAALAGPGIPLDLDARREIVRACQRANEKHLVNRFRTFHRLISLAKTVDDHEESLMYLNDQFLADLLVWYHLAWMGEYARSNDIRIKSLEKKRIGFTIDDRRSLVTAISDLVGGTIERYRKLADDGRVELSVTPYAHPIMPLLLDMGTAREAMPEVTMPKAIEYPGGEPRARWHIRKGIEVFKRHFGFAPLGCWPSEGGVSSETLRLLEEEGFQWTASGQQVLHNSLSAASGGEPLPVSWVHKPYRLEDSSLCAFFRDDGLSDLIGFTYADWHADDAVANLLQHLETIAEVTRGEPNRVVSIIMDGENAWEYYPRNGCFFLTTLYEKLAGHPRLELTTFSDCVKQQTAPVHSLPNLVAGSWVYGTFSTWIGDPDKNRGWEMLVDAKVVYDRVIAENRLGEEQQQRAAIQLARCEGSDWFWWFGDYNPGDTVSDFERLFRLQLTYLYQLLGETAPTYLSEIFARGSGDPSLGGVMRQNR